MISIIMHVVLWVLGGFTFYVMLRQGIGTTFREWYIEKHWDSRQRALYRLFDPKSSYRQMAHKKLDYVKLHLAEQDVFGMVWHKLDGTFLDHPAVLRSNPLNYDFRQPIPSIHYDDIAMAYGERSAAILRADLGRRSSEIEKREHDKHYCTDVPDSLQPCRLCEIVNQRNNEYIARADRIAEKKQESSEIRRRERELEEYRTLAKKNRRI